MYVGLILNAVCPAFNLTFFIANERLQTMMGIMARERNGQVFATDERSENGQFPRSL